MMNNELGPFAELANKLPDDPQLTQPEKDILLQLSEHGGPLWKIVKSSLDYANHMRDHIAAIELVGPAQIELARQLQLKRQAALAYLTWFVQSYAPPPAVGKKKEQVNG